MAIQFVQSAKNDAGSGTSVAQAYASNNAAGNLLVAAVVWNAVASITSVTDSAGNTWTLAQNGLNVGNLNVSLYYAANSVAGANTVTVAFDGLGSTSRLIVAEYSGIATASPVSGTPKNGTGNGTALNSGNTPTDDANTVLVFAGGVTNLSQTAFTVGTNYTEREDTDSATFALELSDRIVSTAGAYNDTATASNSSQWAAVLAAFKAVSAGRSVAVVIS